MLTVTNAQLKLLKKLSNRHQRQKEQAFVIEGVRCVEEVLKQTVLIRHLFATEHFLQSQDWQRIAPFVEKGLPVALISEQDVKQICETETPQGILALSSYPQEQEISAPPVDPFVLILDKIQDPGNLGTMIRTALAAGLHELWLIQGCTDPFSPKVIRSAMGAQFILKIRWFKELKDSYNCLKHYNYPHFWLTGPTATLSIFEDSYTPNQAGIVIGNEANGIDPHTDFGTWVTIPMPGTAESLNAAQAATIILFDAVRRKVLK